LREAGSNQRFHRLSAARTWARRSAKTGSFSCAGPYPRSSPDGRLLLLPWSEGAPAEIVDAESGRVLASLPSPESTATRYYGAVGDAGRWVVQGRGDARLSLWNVQSGIATEYCLEEKNARPESLAFLPGLDVCVVLTTGGVLLLDVPRRQRLGDWKLPAGVRLKTFVPSSDLAVSRDGTRLALRAVAGDDVMIYVLSVGR
ncbi:MAG: hypothetical protein JXQ29_15425, partial [Planctomycetes bacterium]|nr:hypothetical protein [Planctomycetota bacterium]